MNFRESLVSGLSLLLAILLLSASCKGNSGGSAAHSPSSNPKDLKQILDQMLLDAEAYSMPEGLPGRADLLKALAASPQGYWQDLTPMQLFFVLETDPGQGKVIAPEMQREAYMTAISTLPMEWWGEWSYDESETRNRLLALPGIEARLIESLTDERRVRMGDSESATLAKMYQYQAGDVAAALLHVMHKMEPYNFNQEVGERIKYRRDLADKLTQP
ncbi:MAG: hypothetical protein H6581_26780 [Bacteroidia bacterium]|nr:hypothetical protein [Bacteroidia bacterium]